MRKFWRALPLVAALLAAWAGSGLAQSISTPGVMSITTAACLTAQTINPGQAGTIVGAETVNSQSGTSYTVADSDRCKLVTIANASSVAVTLPQAGSGGNFASGWVADFENTGAGTVTITPTTSTIDGAANLVLSTNQGVRIVSNGSNYFTQRGIGSGGGGGSVSITAASPNVVVSPSPLTGTGTVGTTAPYNQQTGTSYTVLTGDNTKILTFSNASPVAVTLPQAGSAGFGSGWSACFVNINTGLVTITTTTSTINGSGQTAKLPQGASACLASDPGANWSGTMSIDPIPGTSGGVPYYSAVNQLSSSALLPTNVLVKGGGAGGAPAASTITDGGAGVIIGAPTGGAEGAGTINVQNGIFSGGAQVPTISGAITTGHCTQWAGATSLSDSGSACGAGGGSLTVTDGTHTVGSTTQITFTGATVGGTTPNATVTVSGGGSTTIVQPQGRLTLVSGSPIHTSSQTAKSQVFYDCYIGNGVPYWNGSSAAMDTIASCEVSMTMATSSTGVTNNAGVFDVFWEGNTNHNICVVTNGSGGGWASDTGGSNTARGTGYSQIHNTKGFYTNVNTVTHCYNGATDYGGSLTADKLTWLGTLTTTAAGQTSMNLQPAAAAGGTANVLGLWNAYNRVKFTAWMRSTTACTDSTASWRQFCGDTSSFINWVDGNAWSAPGFQANSTGFIASNQDPQIAVGFDQNNNFPAYGECQIFTTGANAQWTCNTGYVDLPQMGLHTGYLLERGDVSNAPHYSGGTLTFQLDM